ncbi:skin secretory protein xP2-like [Dermacentor silvarum]|uniref:skin secretory protein xP2-like n=1 Tax=Dermacentor silvarum TaxID=543639 RepID=UPI00189C1F61|nr:skin secretory protein xP2-like [Dermacentor silvarum]
MGDDILQGVAELRPVTPQARSRALNLLLKEASRMFPSPQASQDGTSKRLSPTFFKGAARRTRGARRIPRRHPTKTELQSPAERDDTTPSSSSPTSSYASSSSPADGVDSAASSSSSRPSSPFDVSSTCSPAASPLVPGGETGEDTEPPSPTEGDLGTPERPQPRDSRTPSPSSAPRGAAVADGTAGHDVPDLGRPPTAPLDGEHTPAAESLPRAAVDEGAGGRHGEPVPDNESSTPPPPPPERRLPSPSRGSTGGQRRGATTARHFSIPATHPRGRRARGEPSPVHYRHRQQPHDFYSRIQL